MGGGQRDGIGADRTFSLEKKDVAWRVEKGSGSAQQNHGCLDNNGDKRLNDTHVKHRRSRGRQCALTENAVLAANFPMFPTMGAAARIISIPTSAVSLAPRRTSGERATFSAPAATRRQGPTSPLHILCPATCHFVSGGSTHSGFGSGGCWWKQRHGNSCSRIASTVL